MSKPIYRYTENDVKDIGAAARHAKNGDEIGLTGRRLVLCRLISGMNEQKIEYLYSYFSLGVSLVDIAKRHSVEVSTVSRVIVGAINKINDALYCVDVAGEDDGIFYPIQKRKDV